MTKCLVHVCIFFRVPLLSFPALSQCLKRDGLDPPVLGAEEDSQQLVHLLLRGLVLHLGRKSPKKWLKR